MTVPTAPLTRVRIVDSGGRRSGRPGLPSSGCRYRHDTRCAPAACRIGAPSGNHPTPPVPGTHRSRPSHHASRPRPRGESEDVTATAGGAIGRATFTPEPVSSPGRQESKEFPHALCRARLRPPDRSRPRPRHRPGGGHPRHHDPLDRQRPATGRDHRPGRQRGAPRRSREVRPAERHNRGHRAPRGRSSAPAGPGGPRGEGRPDPAGAHPHRAASPRSRWATATPPAPPAPVPSTARA